jgi:hypothetical protein
MRVKMKEPHSHVVVATGDYDRSFDGPGPHEVTDEEWAEYLQPTGLFEEVQGPTSEIQSPRKGRRMAVNLEEETRITEEVK